MKDPFNNIDISVICLRLERQFNIPIIIVRAKDNFRERKKVQNQKNAATQLIDNKIV